jgi:hypothetical protein
MIHLCALVQQRVCWGVVVVPVAVQLQARASRRQLAPHGEALQRETVRPPSEQQLLQQLEALRSTMTISGSHETLDARI